MVPLATVTTGWGRTTTFAWALARQPCMLVPLTEYNVVARGITTKVDPDMVYDAAPVGTMVKAEPEQRLPLFTDTTGNGCTVTVATAKVVDTQPCALVPFTR